MRFHSKLIRRFALPSACLVTAMLLSGCESEETDPEASTNDIQAYLDENPDAVEKPEDVPADEDAVFESEAREQ